MNCPTCNNKNTKVIESRESSNSVRRRRECISCNERFTTYEKIHITSITVVKRDWTKEDFSIDKLEKGNKPNNYGEYQGSMSNHGKVYENIVEVLKNGSPVTTNMFEGLKTVEIIERIYDEIRK